MAKTLRPVRRFHRNLEMAKTLRPVRRFHRNLETDSNVDDIEELGSASSMVIDNKANESNGEIQNVHLPNSSMAGDTNQTAHSSNAKAGSKNYELRFKCEKCPYTTNYNHHLLTHRRIHTGEKPYKCNQCLYAGAQAINLTRHMRTHTGEKPYKCSKCSYASTGFSALKAHMRTHTGEKPYKCTECTFASATAGQLKIHTRRHTGEKPYKCDKCLYASAQPSDLRTHIRTHTGEKPYKCSQCSFACVKKFMGLKNGDEYQIVESICGDFQDRGLVEKLKRNCVEFIAEEEQVDEDTSTRQVIEYSNNDIEKKLTLNVENFYFGSSSFSIEITNL